MKKYEDNILVGILIILIIGVLIGVSWVVTCLLVKLVAWCFGLAFSWKVATGIWVVLFILKSTFKGKDNN